MLDNLPRHNSEEHNAAQYLTFNLGPLHTLANFAPDPLIRQKARMGIDWLVADTAPSWLNGYQGERWGIAWDDPPSGDSVITIKSPTTYRGSTGGISSLVLRDPSGSGGVNLFIADNGGNGNGFGTFDVSGHHADLMINSLRMGASSNATARTDAFNFNQGALDIVSLDIGLAQNTTFTRTSVVNLGGGTVTLGNGGPETPGLISLSRNAVGVLNLTGGTVAAYTDIAESAGTGSATLNLAGATLDLRGNSIVDLTTTFWESPQSWPLFAATHLSASMTLSSVSDDPAGNIAAAYGNFTLQQNATSVTLVWTPLTALEKWRYANFGSSANTGRGADDADPNHDGELNLLEFATGQDPHAATRAVIALELAAGGVNCVYTRSKAAVDAGFLFTVEISDTLAPDSWTGLGPGALIADGPLQTLAVPLPWTPRRFARLRIDSP